MLLPDKKIRESLEELNFHTPPEGPEFNPDEQIQPCSIDVHLGNQFWIPRKRSRTLHLTKTKLMEIKPRFHWKSKTYGTGETFILKPGGMVLGKVHEKFTVPKDCHGKIEGRSSYARLGLSVHCTGDFMNPGYRGHMPLQLVNNGSEPLALQPFLPIAQVMLGKLDDEPNRTYGDKHLESKYSPEDDGGPSYWWRDKVIKRLQEYMEKNKISDDTVSTLLVWAGHIDPDVLYRLEDFIESRKVSELTNAEELLEKFNKSERSLEFKHRVISWFSYGLPWVLFGLVAAHLYTAPWQLTKTSIALYAGVIFSVVWAAYWMWRAKPIFLTKDQYFPDRTDPAT